MEEEVENEGLLAREFIKKEVRDWDDDIIMNARFKAFSGQRSDWENKYLFWRDLIIKLATHLKLFIIKPSQVKDIWFNRGGLTPLCLDHVLLEMYNAGDILRIGDLVDPTSGRLSQIFRRVIHLVGLPRLSTPVEFTEDHLILSTLLREKAVEVIKVLSDNHWSSSCVITMKRFQAICGGSQEAYAVLSHLSGCGKAKYLVLNKKEFIEGVKVSLSSGAVLNIISLDYNVLHLIWTEEMLQQRLDVIDQRCETSKKLALASLRSGNKTIALRHARELKLTSQSREKCTMLFNRVEEVLRVIADAESSKAVSEAIQIGAKAVKENKISVEEVQICLQELDEGIESQKELERVLESTPSYAEIDDEDVEDEFAKLELEFGESESPYEVPISKVKVEETTAESLTNTLSNLKLTDDPAMNTLTKDTKKTRGNNIAKETQLEAA